MTAPRYHLTRPSGPPVRVDCSVVMLAYNRERLLPATLAALLHQQLGRATFELVLVDDGSRDGTARIARAFRPPFPYQYLSRENNDCRAAARNLGVRHARGEILLFLDADCVATPTLIAAHVRRHLEGGSRAVAGGLRLLRAPVPPHLPAEAPALIHALPQSQRPYLPRLVHTRAHAFVTAHCSCRRSDLVSIGMFDEAFKGYGGEDIDVGERLERAGIRVDPAGEVAAFHQPHPLAPNREASDRAAAERIRRKHHHPFRILHVLQPADDPDLARALGAYLRERHLSQYRMEIAASGAAAELLRGAGFHPCPPEAALADGASFDLIQVHTLNESLPAAQSSVPTLQTTHCERPWAERPPALWLKIQYDIALCGAQYPEVPLAAPREASPAVALADWLPSDARQPPELRSAGAARAPRARGDSLLRRRAANPVARAPALPVAFRAVLGRPLRLCWEGDQDLAAGFARVNRELCLELLRSQDVELTLRWPDHQWAAVGAGDGRLSELFALRNRRLSGPPDVTVRHRFPPVRRRPPAGRLVIFQPWEYDRVPSEWVRMSRIADEVWTCSRFVRLAFLRSGSPAEKLHLAPYGFNPELFRPDGPVYHLPSPGRPGRGHESGSESWETTFLFVGGALERKGADLLLRAFLEAFSPSDSVRLVVKDLGSRSFYRGSSLAHAFRRAAHNPRAPAVAYIDADLDDATLASLYRLADCLVLPYRGEGFALTALEAMACGLPVIATAGGPTDDYLDDRAGLRLPFSMAPVPAAELERSGAPECSRRLEPDLSALVAALRHVREHPDETAQRGAAARELVAEGWTWAQSAALLRARLLALICPERALVPARQESDRSGAQRASSL